jgi:hypothetical protein
MELLIIIYSVFLERIWFGYIDLFSLLIYILLPITLVLIQLSISTLIYKNFSKTKSVILYTLLVSFGLSIINILLLSLPAIKILKDCSDMCFIGLLYLPSVILLIISTIITIIVLSIKMNKRRVFPPTPPNSGLPTHEPNNNPNNQR